MTTNKVESLHCFFVFEWTELKFGVRGNFGLLTSNFNSKTQHQFEILRKMPLVFFSIMILVCFSDSSKMMLKLGRNIQWVETL